MAVTSCGRWALGLPPGLCARTRILAIHLLVLTVPVLSVFLAAATTTVAGPPLPTVAAAALPPRMSVFLVACCALSLMVLLSAEPRSLPVSLAFRRTCGVLSLRMSLASRWVCGLSLGWVAMFACGSWETSRYFFFADTGPMGFFNTRLTSPRYPLLLPITSARSHTQNTYLGTRTHIDAHSAH